MIGCESSKFVSPGTAGVPDRIVFTPYGKIYFVELKQTDGTVSPKQALWIRRHREKYKVKVWILFGPEDVKEFLKHIEREAQRYGI